MQRDKRYLSECIVSHNPHEQVRYCFLFNLKIFLPHYPPPPSPSPPPQHWPKIMVILRVEFVCVCVCGGGVLIFENLQSFPWWPLSIGIIGCVCGWGGVYCCLRPPHMRAIWGQKNSHECIGISFVRPSVAYKLLLCILSFIPNAFSMSIEVL